MHTSPRFIRMTVTLLLLAGATSVWAYPRFARLTGRTCATCHANVAGGPDFTAAGKAFKADSTKVPADSVAGAEYVSSRKCKVCHLAEYKSWQETPHAKSFEVLKSGDPKKIEEMAARAGVKLDGPAWTNAACLGCHVTGHALKGGYPDSDSLKTAALSAVACEACHGPGSKHVAADKAVKKKFINGHITEVMCIQCHTPTMSPKFNFAEYKEKGVHAVKVVE